MKLSSLLSRFKNDENGTVAVILSIILLPILFAAGAAFDYSRVSQTKASMGHALDAATLATGKSLSDGETNKAKLKQYFTDFLMANLKTQLKFGKNIKIASFAINETTVSVSATVTSEVPLTFMSISGRAFLPIVNEASVGFDKTAGSSASIFLVMDRSSSMGRHNRLQSLKEAVAEMSQSIKQGDPDDKFVRMGAVGYDKDSMAPQPLSWGTGNANAYTQNLTTGSGTASADAFSKAYTLVTAIQEEQQHREKTGLAHRKVLVLLTDGANNETNDDDRTKATCAQARANNVEVYSIAFQAASRGQKLLKACATTTEHYFKAQNRQDLIKAFAQIGAGVKGDLALTK